MQNDPVPYSRTTHRFNSLLMLILLLVLSGLLAWTSHRLPAEFDWTRTGRHSVSEAGTKVLERLQGGITVTAYARDQAPLRLAISDFIAKYQRIKADIDLRFINPDSVPDEVRELGISINGELVLEFQGRTEHVRAADESTFINALIRLTRGTDKWIVFLEGHGERHPLGKANHDLGDWVHHLGNRGYNTQPLNLAEVNAVPDNTSVLVLAGPQVPLLPGEIDILLRYLEQGGNLLWLLDPGEKGVPEQLTGLLGIAVPAGTIIDVAGQLIGINDPTIVMITSSLYGRHPALNGFNFTTLFPKAAPLLPAQDGGWTTTVMLSTGDHTWLETGPLDNNSRFDVDADLQGPLTIAIGMERTVGSGSIATKQQKIIIMGDGDFLSNTYLGNSGNLDLGIRFINWLSEDDNLIDIPARIAADTQLTVSPVIMGITGILLLLGMPLLLLVSGLAIWWRRRRS